MILKLKAIKQIIKEELEKVVNEDLYTDEEEYEEAIKDFMELHKVSREEAKKAIDAAGDEMDDYDPDYKTSVEEEKENIEAFRTFIKMASGGRRINGEWAYEERQDLRDLAMDFKNNLQAYFKKNKYYKIIFKGYEFCKTYMYDKHGFWDQAADAYGKLNKPLLQRDIGAAVTMAKLEPQLQADIEERTEKCEENLVFALSYVDRQIERDKDDAERKKRKEEREKAKNQLIKKGIPEEYVNAAIKSGTVLTDTLKWSMDKWEDWMEKDRRGQMRIAHRKSIRDQGWRDYTDTGGLNDPDYFTESKFRLTQNEIKKIIKEELERVLSEQLSDQITYKQLRGILELAAGIKGDVARESLKAIAKGADLSNDVISLIGGVMGIAENKQPINEVVLTLAAVVGGIKAVAGAKALYSLGKAAYDKYKGKPTTVTDKMPLLDILNLDPRYSEILDDRLEEEFIMWWQERVKNKPDGELVDTNELNVNVLLPKWLKEKYPEVNLTASNPDVPGPNFQYSVRTTKRALDKLSKKKAVSDIV